MLFSVSKGSMKIFLKNVSKQMPHGFITGVNRLNNSVYFSPIMLWSKLTVAAI